MEKSIILGKMTHNYAEESVRNDTESRECGNSGSVIWVEG